MSGRLRIGAGVVLIGAAVFFGVRLVGDTPGAPASVADYALRLDLVVGGLQSPSTSPLPPASRGRSTSSSRSAPCGSCATAGSSSGRSWISRTGCSRAASRGCSGSRSIPDYERNRRFYVHYSNLDGDTRVVEYTQGTGSCAGAPRRSSSRTRTTRAARSPSGRTGGSTSGSATAARPSIPERRSQDPGSLLGKLLALDVDSGGQPEIVAYGLRNPWRFAFDEDANVFIADVGQDKWEEVNVLPAGEQNVNFGWDVYEGRDRLNDIEPTGDGRLAEPIAVYPHGVECSIIGGRVYRGDVIPKLRGRYLYGDFCSGRIWSLAWDGGDDADVRLEAAALPTLTAFGEGPDRELYLASQAGALYRLTFVP